MKRLTAFILCLAMIFALAACTAAPAADDGKKTETTDQTTTNTPTQAEKPAEEKKESTLDIGSDKVVTSPLVGTFYSSASPEAEAFVKEGDTVKKGQVLGIIEAMKLMNEIESEYDGIVEAVLVNNEEVVEYGQPLFRIK